MSVGADVGKRGMGGGREGERRGYAREERGRGVGTGEKKMGGRERLMGSGAGQRMVATEKGHGGETARQRSAEGAGWESTHAPLKHSDGQSGVVVLHRSCREGVAFAGARLCNAHAREHLLPRELGCAWSAQGSRVVGCGFRHT